MSKSYLLAAGVQEPARSRCSLASQPRVSMRVWKVGGGKGN